MGKGSLKNPFLGGGGDEKPIYRGDCLKGGGGCWTVCRFEGGWGGVVGGKEGVFLRRGLIY